MPYPTDQTHSIQITRTVAALGQHIDVLFVVGALTVPREDLQGAIRRQYGVELGPRVRIAVMPRRRLRTLTFPFALKALLRDAPTGTHFYTRSVPVAAKLVRFRWLHRKRVFLETHKKAGYVKEDPVPGSRYSAIRERFEKTNERLSFIRRLYSRVDCLFFLHRHSMDIARREVALRDSEHLWYGCRAERPVLEPRGGGFVHCGSIAEHKLFDLLLDALDRSESQVRVSVYGGDPSRIAELRHAVRGRPCSERLDFRGWFTHADLQRQLSGFQYGIALQEGLKVVDYLENGLLPIVPDLPSYRDVLDDRHAFFFRADDPESLARCLDRAGERRPDPVAIDELLTAYSVDRRAEKILAHLG